MTTELQREQGYLDYVYEQLLHSQAELSQLLDYYETDGRAKLSVLASEVRLNFGNDSDTLETFANFEMKSREIDQMNLRLETASKLLERVVQSLKAPYFGKIQVDFLDGDSDEDSQTFYIGRHGFESEDSQQLIYDWRSPIAELFYNNDIGPSHYEVHQQRIDVDIEARRQLIVEANRLLNYFDASVAIQDDVLLEALKQDATAQMTDITSTIQKEQNVIIRDMNHPLLLVNGVAGSGKTSTIMQRIAYLLYTLRSEITSDNVLILSPNHNFIDYISNVLPALGESNPLNMTFLQLLDQYLPWEIENETDYFNRISAELVDEQTATLRTADYYHFAKIAGPLIASHSIFRPLTYKGKVIISTERMQQFFDETPVDNSLQARLQASKQKLAAYWERRIRKQASKPKMQNQILTLSEEMQEKYFGSLIADESNANVVKLGRQFLTKKYQGITDAIQTNQWINLEAMFDIVYHGYTKGKAYQHMADGLSTVDEAVIYLTLSHHFIEKLTLPEMRFVLIDEVQDYTPAQINLLKDLFMKSEFTMVGDENQAIFNSAIAFDDIQAIFEQSLNTASSKVGLSGRGAVVRARRGRNHVQRYDLLNSYRSSGAITQAFSQLASSKEDIAITPIRPYGLAPEIYPIQDVSDYPTLLKQLMAGLAEGSSLAIITKTAEQADNLRAYLEANLSSALLDKGASHYQVLPISTSKGLEFDHVLAADVSAENYTSDREKRILYTAFSRAMDRLFITYQGTASPFLEKIQVED